MATRRLSGRHRFGCEQYNGGIYGEASRGNLATRGEKVEVNTKGKSTVIARFGTPEYIQKLISGREWNQLRLVAVGNHITQFVNGVKTVELIDNDIEGDGRRMDSGLLGLQLHKRLPMTVRFRNIRIRPSTSVWTNLFEVIDTKVGTSSMAVSPDGKLIATSSEDQLEKINIWDATTGKLLSQLKSPGDFTSAPFRLAFSPDSKSLLMVVQNQVAVVSATDGKLEKSFDFPAPPKLVVFPKQTIALAVYHEKTGHRTELGDIPQYLRIWNWKTRKTLLDEQLSMDRGTIRNVSISPDERFLITCRQNYANKVELKLDGEKASLGKSVDFEYVNRIRSKMVFSNNGKYAAFSIKGKGGMAAIFDAETRQVLHLVDPDTAKEKNGGYVYGCNVVFKNDGSSYVTADHTGRIAQWETTTGKFVREVGYLKTSGLHITPHVAITKDDRIIVAGGEADPRIVIVGN